MMGNIEKKIPFANLTNKLKKLTSATGFEPVRAEPKRFQVFLLNHSDKLTLDVKIPTPLCLDISYLYYVSNK